MFLLCSTKKREKNSEEKKIELYKEVIPLPTEVLCKKNGKKKEVWVVCLKK